MANLFGHLVVCWWDVPALIALIAATAWFLAERHKLKKEKDKLEKQR